MPLSVQENTFYRFADCELDPHEHRLLAHGQAVTLTPKVFETLVLLVGRAGHVVSKDELMAALWPRGFVHESNLTKHIWMIRRALGDGEDESRYIETVPKLGYRFIAPVQLLVREDADGGSAPQPAVAGTSQQQSSSSAISVGTGGAPNAGWTAGRDPERRHDGYAAELVEQGDALTTSVDAAVLRRANRVRLSVLALIVIVVLLGGLYLWHFGGQPAWHESSVPDTGAVALVDFNNLSGNAKDAWLGPALEQMLATEVAVGGHFHAVPEELVRPARADLPAPDAGGYAPASLIALQRRLGTHYVLSGAYLVSGTADAPQLRVDVTVQDAQTGKPLASMSRDAAVSDLPRLVAQVGGDLRNRLGLRPSAAAVLQQTANAQPPTAEVARHLGFALDALAKYDPARARDELLQAIAQAPGYAPAYMYLARAWSALGYRAKALAASKQALANANGLPQEQRLQIRAQEADLQADHAQAIAAYEKLVALRPDDPGLRLQLVNALAESGEYAQAGAALADARKLPALANDPRVELAAGKIAIMQDNTTAPAMVDHARRALRLAQKRGEDGLVADAELQLGIALNQSQEADTLLRKAAADFKRIGNPHGEAQAYQNLANLMDSLNQIPAARETYQRAMAIYQGVGDLGGEAAIYDNLSRMLWATGDRDGTEAALRQALRIGRETDDLVRQAWSLTGLATVESDEAASDEAADMYRQAIALDRQSGARSHFAFALATYADLLRLRGQLDDARTACAKAQDAAHALNDSEQIIYADFECAQVALDRGDTDRALSDFATLERQAIAAKDSFYTANAQLVLGQIRMGRRQWDEARDSLQDSLHGWIAQKEAPGEATAEALLALCHAALGDAAARDNAAARARALRSGITARQEVFYLDIALAELQADTGNPGQAMIDLQALTEDAAKRKWIGLAFEARLAAQRVLDRGADRAAAKTSRDALAADARKAGFGWVGQRLAMVQPAPGRH